MNHFYVLTNKSKDPDLSFTREVCEYINGRGIACTGYLTEDTDCVIVLGGDGTVLQAAREVIGKNIPILGINLGTLGFLAEVEKREWQKAISQMISGNFKIEKRMMLESIPRSENETPIVALNDVVISRTGALRIMSYDIYVNGQFLNSFSADGIIISTPTGSTAYSLSAGGPIVEPGASMIILTPICPHTLNTRSVILSCSDVVTIKVGKTSSDPVLEAEADFDGHSGLVLKTGEEVSIRKSALTTSMIKLDQRSFLEIVHRKMQG